MDEAAVRVITSSLGRIETTLATKADKEDIRRVDARLRRVEQAQVGEESAIEAVQEHERKRGMRRRELVEIIAAILSVTAIVVSVKPF